MFNLMKYFPMKLPKNIPAFSMSMSVKPPNILVHLGSGCVEKEESLISVVKEAVGDDKYVVYAMKDLESQAWRKNTALLVQGGSVNQETAGRIGEYMDLGGRLLMLREAQLQMEQEPDKEFIQGIQIEVWRKERSACAIRLVCSSPTDLSSSTLSSLLSQYLNLRCCMTPSSPPPLSPGYLLAGSIQEILHNPTIASRIQGQVLKQTNLHLDLNPPPGYEPRHDYLPVLDEADCPTFSKTLYLSLLSTRSLGRTLLYCPVMGSSMAPFEGSPLTHGFTVVPRQQTSGRGRGGNSWLSPVGCAMFSLQLHLTRDSHLGRCVPLVQHLVALSQVHAIRKRPGYEDLDVRLKWPNDTYYGPGVKLGGVITTCQTGSSHMVVSVGSGINLSNDSPTLSLNNIIQKRNQETGGDLALLGQEDLLANTFNQLESLIEDVNEGRLEEAKQLYYRYWLHGGQRVSVKRGDRMEEVVILGIDDFGYIEARGKEGLVTIHPDGNSFDMMEGLIAPKQR